MAGRKKDDNAAGFVLILVCVILWGIYVAVRALINLNERFIDAVSNLAGIIGLFFGLLTVFAILFRFFIYRRLRKKTAAFEQAVSELVQRERDFNETVNAATGSHGEGIYHPSGKSAGAGRSVVSGNPSGSGTPV